MNFHVHARNEDCTFYFINTIVIIIISIPEILLLVLDARGDKAINHVVIHILMMKDLYFQVSLFNSNK